MTFFPMIVELIDPRAASSRARRETILSKFTHAHSRHSAQRVRRAPPTTNQVAVEARDEVVPTTSQSLLQR